MLKVAASQRALVLLGLSAALTVASYGNTFNSPFHFDDSHSIQDNVWIQSFEHVPKFFTDVTTFSPLAENRSYRPILLMGYALSHAIGGGAMWGYHLITILLHILGAVWVGLLAWRLLLAERFDDRWAWGIGVASSAMFSVHPLLSEPVNYISARSSLQAAVLMFGAVYLYIRGRESNRSGYLMGSAALLLLAMGTQIIAMTAPALMLGWEITHGPDRRASSVGLSTKASNWIRAIWPAIAVVIGFTLLHEALMGADNRAARSIISAKSYFLTETIVWLKYIGLFIWPQDLCADLVMPWRTSPFEGPVARAILSNLVLIGVALACIRKRPTVAFGIAWFYITLSPTNSVVPLSEPATEHRVYIAVPGLVWTVGALAAYVGRRVEWTRVRRYVAWAAAITLFAALGARTFVRNRVWATDHALWKSVVEASPDNGRAHLNYGLALMAQGELRQARSSFDECAKQWPGYVFCYINRAVLELREKRIPAAEREIAKAERIRPNNIYVLQWRGEVERAAERWANAEGAYRRALKVAPGYGAAELGLAVALFEQGKSTDAKPLLAKVRARKGLDTHGWFAVGFFAEQDKDRAAARAAYETALRYDPDNRRARYNLAVLHQNDGRIDHAIVEYEYLAKAPDVSPDVLFNLTGAYWRKNRLDRARAVRTRLRQRAPRYPGLPKLTF